MTIPEPRADTTILPIAVAQADDLGLCAEILEKLVSRSEGLGPDAYLREFEATQHSSNPRANATITVVAQCHNQLAQRQKLLSMAVAGGHDLAFLQRQGVFAVTNGSPPRTAAIFPGQGMQYPNMLRQAASHFPGLQRTLERTDAAYQKMTGRTLRASFWVDEEKTYQESDEDIPCALFAVNIALFELLRSYGCRFDAVMGQSISDVAAIVASGALSLEEGLEVVWQRNQILMTLGCTDRGRMISLLCGPKQAEELIADLDGYAVIAAYNCPTACIVSVSTEVAEALLDRCAQNQVRGAPVAISHAYHSALIADAAPPYRKIVDGLDFHPLRCELVSSITGSSMQAMDAQVLRDQLVQQLADPIHVQNGIETLYANGTRLFIECGPKSALTTYVNETLAGLPHTAQPTLHPQVGELEHLFRALACMFAHGNGQWVPHVD